MLIRGGLLRASEQEHVLLVTQLERLFERQTGLAPRTVYMDQVFEIRRDFHFFNNVSSTIARLHCQRTCAHETTTIYRWPAGCAADLTARH